MKTLKRLEKNHVWTWIGHSFVAIMLPAFFMIFVLAFLLDPGLWAYVSYTGGVAVMGYYYGRIREPADKRKAAKAGILDKREADLTKRIDGAGDALGPYSAAVSVLTGLTMFVDWWAPIIPIAIALAYMGYETGRAI